MRAKKARLLRKMSEYEVKIENSSKFIVNKGTNKLLKKRYKQLTKKDRVNK